MAVVNNPGYRKYGGTGGGGPPTPGNLKWGPQFGNNEKETFGAAASITLASKQLGILRDLFVAASIALKGTINALFSLFVQTDITIFFTLVFLYSLNVAAMITMPALRLAGGLAVASAITAILSLSVFPFNLSVAASIRMVALQLAGSLPVQSSITGVFNVGGGGFVLNVAAAIRMVALQISFLGTSGLNVASQITMPALFLKADTAGGGLKVASQISTAISIGPGAVEPCAPETTPYAGGAYGKFPYAGIAECAVGGGGLTLGCRTASLGLTYQLDWQVHTGDRTFIIPNGVTSLAAEVWAAGGGGGTATVNGGGGGGGGGYARENAFTVAAADSLTVTRGAGGAVGVAGGQSKVNRGGTNIAVASGGTNGANGGAGGHGAGGAGGAGTVGDNFFTGGTGGGPSGGVNTNGGGGGGGAGDANNGVVGGAAPGAGGAGGAVGGGGGGAGANGNTAAVDGSLSGGGGGGASTLAVAAAGANGRVRLTMAA
jgi:hypothetical protein